MNKILFIVLMLMPCQCWSDDATYSPLDQQATTTEYSPLPTLKEEQLRIRESLIVAKGSLERTKQEEAIASKERNLQYQLQNEAIKKRIDDYIRQGALPARPLSVIVINGKKYPGYDSFLNTIEGQNWLAYQKARHAWDAQKKKIDEEYNERLRKESFQRLVEYEKLSWNEKRTLEAKKRVEAFMGHPGPYMRESVYIPPTNKDDMYKQEIEDRLKKADAEVDKYLEELDKRTPKFSEQQ